MEKPLILHMFTPDGNVSPFDVNMAYDAGYAAVVPYGGVHLDQIAALTQDVIFSRGPKGVKRTGIFIGGREIGLAADMLEAARGAMVPPFEVCVFADPSGAFTTAASMVACVEHQLARTHETVLEGKNVLVLGGTGPVGTIAAVLAAGAGAFVRIASRSGATRARATCESLKVRYGISAEPVDISVSDEKSCLLGDAEVILATVKAGVQILSKAELERANRLLAVADVNAVPPEGIEGLGVMDDGAPLAAGSSHAVGIGALAIGNVKYQVQRGLLETMLRADKALYLDFRDAFATARKLTS